MDARNTESKNTRVEENENQLPDIHAKKKHLTNYIANLKQVDNEIIEGGNDEGENQNAS